MGTKCERCRKTFWLVECRKRHPHAILLGYRMGFLFVVGVFLLPSPTCRKLTQNRLNLLRQNATLTALFSPTPPQLHLTLLNCFFTHFQTLCSPFFQVAESSRMHVVGKRVPQGTKNPTQSRGKKRKMSREIRRNVLSNFLNFICRKFYWFFSLPRLLGRVLLNFPLFHVHSDDADWFFTSNNCSVCAHI